MYEKKGANYFKTIDKKTPLLLAEGKIIQLSKNFIFIKKNDRVKSIPLPFNEIEV